MLSSEAVHNLEKVLYKDTVGLLIELLKPWVGKAECETCHLSSTLLRHTLGSEVMRDFYVKVGKVFCRPVVAYTLDYKGEVCPGIID